MNKYIIATEKGYICEKNAKGYYENSNNNFYRKETGKFFTSINSNCDKVDKLGFTNNIEDATKYGSLIGNRVQEVIDRINYGYENFSKVEILLIKE